MVVFSGSGKVHNNCLCCHEDKVLAEVYEQRRRVYLVEVLERVLVHGVHVGQLGDDEVDDAAAAGHRPVLLPGGRDLQLSGLGLRQPDTDVPGRDLPDRRHRGACRTLSGSGMRL